MADGYITIHIVTLAASGAAILAALGGAATYFARVYAAAKNARIEQLKGERDHFRDLCCPSLLEHQLTVQRELRQQLVQIRGQLEATAVELSTARVYLDERTAELETLRDQKELTSEIARTVILDRGKLQVNLRQAVEQLHILQNTANKMDRSMDKFSSQYEARLRQLLGIPEDATVEQILATIEAEGWTHRLLSQVVDGVTLWACPISRGIFRTAEQDLQTGRMGHEGSPTSELAALEGLRRARGENPPGNNA